MHPLRVSGGVGDPAGSWGWGAAEVGAKTPVGTKLWGQPAPCLGAAQPWRSRAVQPIGARQYLSLGGNKNCPVGLIQKATAILSPQNLLSVVSYLINCWRSAVVRKFWVFLHWLEESVQQGEIFTLKLSWDNSWAFTLSLVLAIFILSASKEMRSPDWHHCH